jgi:hypothetical protein
LNVIINIAHVLVQRNVFKAKNLQKLKGMFDARDGKIMEILESLNDKIEHIKPSGKPHVFEAVQQNVCMNLEKLFLSLYLKKLSKEREYRQVYD